MSVTSDSTFRARSLDLSETASLPSRRGFVTHDAASAPPEARPLLEGTRRQVGFLPVGVGRLAESPALLKGFFQLLDLFERTSLSSLEREVVVMAVARENGCHFCQALHTARLLSETARPVVLALREGRPTGQVRLDALTAFTRATLQQKGDVAAPVWEAFLAAGFSRAQALEVVMGVAATVLSTTANRLVEAPIDAELAAFAPGRELPPG